MNVAKGNIDKLPDEPSSRQAPKERSRLSVESAGGKERFYQPKLKETFAIRYRTTPYWLVAMTTTLASLAALVVLIWPTSLTKLFLLWSSTAASGLPFIMFEICFRALLLLVLGFFVYVASECGRHDVIILSNKGLQFPLAFAASLLFRPKRSWDDIGNILLGSFVSRRNGDYEFELERAKDKNKLFIYFKSGGHVGLDLNCMSSHAMEKLFSAIESWCITYSRSPRSASSKKITPRLGIDEGNPKDLSYTQLWDEELQAHFSATNFVPLEKGARLQNGRITVLMQLSSGGLSAVYLVEQANREVAVLKEASLPRSLDELSHRKAKELLAREVSLLKRLSHPRIAKVLDHFVENGRDYLLVEFLPGQTLRQIVRASGPQSERTVLNWARQISVLVDYLHSQSPPIIHRDVGPDNIIVNEQNEIALIDFGAANEFVGTATGTLIGKQCYMAPEQFRGRAIPSSDIYAIGGTLHFLLTGYDPDALSQSKPKELRADVSEEANSLVASCTELESSQRLKSASDLIDQIDRVLPRTFVSLNPKGKHTSQ